MMGITIHYHGQMADLDRIDELEDRVIDMMLEMGGSVRLWRSAADHDPQRVIRGLILDVAPGLDTFSMLISPEGWLVPLMCIEDAENNTLSMPPYCFCKTQYGPPEGHVAVVTLLDFLKREFFPNLEVRDEAEYWERRDMADLVRRLRYSQRLISGFADAIRNDSLSSEAAEDPEIVITRLTRLAGQLHDTLARPSEHPPVKFDDETEDGEINEAQWDAFYRHQRRKDERLKRAIEERRNAGLSPSAALDEAMRSEGLIDLPVDPDLEDADSAVGFNLLRAMSDEEEEPRTEWQTNLAAEIPWAESEDDDNLNTAAGGDQDWNESEESNWRERDIHPLLQRAQDLHVRFYDLFRDDEAFDPVKDQLLGAMGDVSGGLAQALCDGDTDLSPTMRGLSIIQLKRTLRGAAFVVRCLFRIHEQGVIGQADYMSLTQELSSICDEANKYLRAFRGSST